MPASGGDVVVNVKADLSQFDRGMSRVDRTLTETGGRSARVQAQFEGLLGSVRSLRRDAERLDTSLKPVGPTMGNMALRAGAFGAAAFLLGQNIKQLGDEASVAARAGGFLTNFVSGNFVAAFRAASAETKLTDEQLRTVAQSSDALTLALQVEAAGWDKLADSIRAARAELLTGFVLTDVNRQLGSPTGGLAARDRIEDALATGRNAPERARDGPVTGLTQGLKTALSAAFASPGTRDDIAQLRRAEKFLTEALKNKQLDDVGRQELFDSLTNVRSQLEALTKKDKPKEKPVVPLKLEDRLAKAELQGVKQTVAALRDIETFLAAQVKIERDINRRVEERQRLRDVRQQITKLLEGDTAELDAARQRQRGLFGGLFQGPFLTGEGFQTAQRFGFQARPRDLVRDIREQVRQFARFREELRKLERMGVPKGTIAELESLGPGALPNLQALSGNRGALKQFIGFAKQRERQIEKAARMEVSASTVNVSAGTVNVNSGNPTHRGGARHDTRRVVGQRRGGV